MILFDEWGTSGQNRPTIEHLYKLLNQIPLYRASDYIAENILKIPPPERPMNGPGRRIDISLPTPSYNIDKVDIMLDGQPTPGTSAIERRSLLGENMDISTIDNSFKKRNVIPTPPSNGSQPTIITTVMDSDKENGPETPELINECSRSDWSSVQLNEIPKCMESIFSAGNSSSVKSDNNAPELITECSRPDWSSVNSGNVPICIFESISSAHDSGTVISDNNASGRINDPLARECNSLC